MLPSRSGCPAPPGWAQVILAWGGIVLVVVLVWQFRAGDDCVPTNTNGC
jgi:hypothetical protein